MSNKAIYIICIFFFSVFNVNAQNSFFVQLKNNNNILKATEVNVTIYNSSFTFYTDSLGVIEIKDIANNTLVDIYLYSLEKRIELKSFNNNYTTPKQINVSNYATEHNAAVVTGQPKAMLSSNSIQKVDVITRKEILQRGAFTLNEALKLETGFNFQQDNILGSNLNIQGIGGQNIKILINGIPVNGRENGNIDISQVNLANVDRIEYIKGPMSVIYGSDALGGVINIITRNDKSQNEINLNAQYESIGKYNINTSIVKSIKDRKYNLGIGRNLFTGWGFTDTYKRFAIWKPKEQYFLESGFSLTKSKFNLNYNLGYMREHILNLGSPIVDPFEAMALDENYYNARLSNTTSLQFKLKNNDKLSFTNNHSFYSRKRVKTIKDMTTLEEQLTTNRGDQDTTLLNNVNFRGLYVTEKIKNTILTLGYEINAEFLNSSKIENQKKNIQDYAIYSTANIDLSKKFSLQPSLRYSINSIAKTPIIPNLNLKYKANSTIDFRASWGTGFRVASLKETYLQFIDQNHFVLGNENLLPEQSYHTQIGLIAKLYKDSVQKLIFTSTGYYNNIFNQISLSLIDMGLNKYQYTNIDEFKNIAVENTIDYTNKSLAIKFSALYNNILTARNNQGIDNWDFNTKATYSFTRNHNYSFTVLYRYLTRQPLLSINSLDNSSGYNSWLPSMSIADAIINANFYNQKLNIQAGIKNIFDVQQLNAIGSGSGIHTSGVQSIQPARSLMLGIGCKF